MWAALIGRNPLRGDRTLALRASEGLRKRIWIIPVSVGYLVSFYLLWLTLRLGMHVGIAYGVWTACGVALVAVAARVLFREPLTWMMGLGIALIVAGVLTIEMAAPRAERRREHHHGHACERHDQSPTRRLVASAMSPTTGGEDTKPTRISQVTTVRPVPARSPGS